MYADMAIAWKYNTLTEMILIVMSQDSLIALWSAQIDLQMWQRDLPIWQMRPVTMEK